MRHIKAVCLLTFVLMVVAGAKAADIKGSVYGGGNVGNVVGATTVNLIGGTVNVDVYGGGMGRLESGTEGNTGYVSPVAAKVGDANVNLNGVENTSDEQQKTLYAEWGLVKGTEEDSPYTVPDASKGCVVKGSIFGCNNLNGSPLGTATVHIYATQRDGATRITNDGEVTNAKVNGVKNNGEWELETFDLKAVYGGGNLAPYYPSTETAGTVVIIDGCSRTSIGQVYGGGNAASTPATSVTVNGTYEIGELFGGGNGKDAYVLDEMTYENPGANVGYKSYAYHELSDGKYIVKEYTSTDGTDKDASTKEKRQANYAYGSGQASVDIHGGTIHSVFGGSNTRGNVRITAVTMLEELQGDDETPVCPFQVDEAYGGGKSAPMDAEAKLLMSCIPGLAAAYGGAEEADILGDVNLTITNGKFDRIFGGNNISGTIRGSITVNIEETGCKPIIIGELYGGGNLAPYSVLGYKQVTEDGQTTWQPREPSDGLEDDMENAFADPVVNVKSFTSIGDIYGGGYGEPAVMVGNPYVNVNVAMGGKTNHSSAAIGDGSKTNGGYPIPSHEQGKIGAVNNVFGGGNAAKVMGNTNVNIATTEEIYVAVPDKNITAETTEVSSYYTLSDSGTYEAASGKAVANTTYYEKQTVVGADIRGNVYGGGNNAEVTGNTNVTIGRENANN